MMLFINVFLYLIKIRWFCFIPITSKFGENVLDPIDPRNASVICSGYIRRSPTLLGKMISLLETSENLHLHILSDRDKTQ